VGHASTLNGQGFGGGGQGVVFGEPHTVLVPQASMVQLLNTQLLVVVQVLETLHWLVRQPLKVWQAFQRHVFVVMHLFVVHVLELVAQLLLLAVEHWLKLQASTLQELLV
jgi:hypothetical protein